MSAPTTHPAQRWLNRIHQGDCLHLMPQIPTGLVDLIVTSPPYKLKSPPNIAAWPSVVWKA